MAKLSNAIVDLVVSISVVMKNGHRSQQWCDHPDAVMIDRGRLTWWSESIMHHDEKCFLRSRWLSSQWFDSFLRLEHIVWYVLAESNWFDIESRRTWMDLMWGEAAKWINERIYPNWTKISNRNHIDEKSKHDLCGIWTCFVNCWVCVMSFSTSI